jgi:hypothetical protein
MRAYKANAFKVACRSAGKKARSHKKRDSINEFVADLQLIYPQIRALFVSHASSAELADTSSEHAFLQTPFRVDDLANTIRGLLDGAKIELASSLGMTDRPTSRHDLIQ